MNNQPLFIWNLSSFNVPIFTLFFVGASCAALAVSVFRLSREDGTELSISAKPLTKSAMVGLKTLVYLLIMLVVMALAVGIVALIKPIFGVYSVDNLKGITQDDYKGIILSILVGNSVSILLFSGISILVSMFGGQVITMISSIGFAFLMVILNFIFGYIVKTPADVISDTYSTEITSINTYTMKQYEEGDSETKPYAGIECYVNEAGTELHHYDTYEYWSKAEKKAKANLVSYFDFGNQLSKLFNSFGLDKAVEADSKKMPIGYDITYKYTFDKATHVANSENYVSKNIPISIYSWSVNQGKSFPCVEVLGNKLSAFSDWYLYSLALGMDYNSVASISSRQWSYRFPGETIYTKIEGPLSLTMDKLFLTAEQKTEAKGYFDHLLNDWWYLDGDYLNNYLTTSDTGIWQGKFSEQSLKDKFVSSAKLQIYFMMLGQEYEYQTLKTYLDNTLEPGVEHNYPFTTAQVVKAYRNDTNFYNAVDRIGAFRFGAKIGTIDDTQLYCVLNTCTMPFVESYSNMYGYSSKSLYSTIALTAIWASIAGSLFVIAMIVYKRTDFK